MASRFASGIAPASTEPVRVPVESGLALAGQGKVKELPSAVVASKMRSNAGKEGAVHKYATAKSVVPAGIDRLSFPAFSD
jgi:hypothetical protein